MHAAAILIDEIIREGRGSSLVVLIMAAVFFYIAYYLTKIGRPPRLRRLVAIDAIAEAVGRAAEMGKPVHYTPGYAYESIATHQGSQTLASINILGYIGQLCARYDVPIIINTCIADAIPLMEETLRLAYLREGKPEKFDPKCINYQPGQSPMVTAILGTFQRERPAANFMIGGLYYESVVIGEAANFIGAMQVGGTANTHQMPFIVATCDYVLLGEELYAAAAYISKEPIQIASIAGEDWIKFLLLALVVLGIILESAGYPLISDFLRW